MGGQWHWDTLVSTYMSPAPQRSFSSFFHSKPSCSKLSPARKPQPGAARVSPSLARARLAHVMADGGWTKAACSATFPSPHATVSRAGEMRCGDGIHTSGRELWGFAKSFCRMTRMTQYWGGRAKGWSYASVIKIKTPDNSAQLTAINCKWQIRMEKYDYGYSWAWLVSDLDYPA